MADLDWTKLQPDPTLFLRYTGQPISFSLPAHPQRSLIHSVIECAGGCLQWPHEPDKEGRRLDLVDKSQPETRDLQQIGCGDIFDVKYVYHCVLQDKLIKEILHYRINEDSRYEVSNENIISIIRHTNNQTWRHFNVGSSTTVVEINDRSADETFDRAAFVNANFNLTRKPYMRSEQKKIIAYLIENDAYGEFRGNEIWKTMAEQKVCEGSRTWQSMRDNFLRQVFPRLKAFKITPEQLKKFQTYGRYDDETDCSGTEKSDENDESDPITKGNEVPSSTGPRTNVEILSNQEPAAQLNEIEVSSNEESESEVPPNNPQNVEEGDEVHKRAEMDSPLSIIEPKKTSPVIRKKIHEASPTLLELDVENNLENSSFTLEEDEKIFRSVRRRLQSDDFWRFVRLESAILNRDSSQLRDRFINAILPKYEKFSKTYKELDHRQTMFGNLKVMANHQQKNPENEVVAARHPSEPDDASPESSLDTPSSSPVPKKISRITHEPLYTRDSEYDESLDEVSDNESVRSHTSRAFKGRGYSKPYTKDEDLKILKFIAENKRYSEVGGISLWKNMENRSVCYGRSHQSMKERFRKMILPNIHLYSRHLSESDINMFRSKILAQVTSRA